MNHPITITQYHVHVYYEAETKPLAATLRAQLEDRFPGINFGRWHDNPIGPHPTGSYQLAFDADVFADLITWLALNRQGLVIFIHPLSGDNLADHTQYAMWMGGMPALDLTIF